MDATQRQRIVEHHRRTSAKGCANSHEKKTVWSGPVRSSPPPRGRKTAPSKPKIFPAHQESEEERYLTTYPMPMSSANGTKNQNSWRNIPYTKPKAYSFSSLRTSINHSDNNNHINQVDGREKAPRGHHDGVDELLADQIRRRLSLPDECSIPVSFLDAYKHEESKRMNDLRGGKLPLSRPVRRRSLLEIGFGKIESYEKMNMKPIGEGTYSTVYKGTSRLTNKLVALKEVNLVHDEGVPFTAIREISILKELKHNNIITLHDIVCTKHRLTLVFEFVEEDLSRYMCRCRNQIHLFNVKLFLYQLLRALAYCHHRRILHRDLKPKNILIAKDGQLKLADFGLARAKGVPTKSYTDEVVTLWYRPPDVLLGNVEYGPCIDMWGVGCIFGEMLLGSSLFAGTTVSKQIECIFSTMGTPDEESWPGLRSDPQYCSLNLPHYPPSDPKVHFSELSNYTLELDLLYKFLKCNPRERISAHSAMLHPYFDSLRAISPGLDQLSDTDSIFSLGPIKLLDESIDSDDEIDNQD